MEIALGIVLVSWFILWLVLTIYGLNILGRRHRGLGILVGLLTLAVIPLTFAIGDFVSRRFSSTPRLISLAITVGVVAMFFGIPILLVVLAE